MVLLPLPLTSLFSTSSFFPLFSSSVSYTHTQQLSPTKKHLSLSPQSISSSTCFTFPFYYFIFLNKIRKKQKPFPSSFFVLSSPQLRVCTSTLHDKLSCRIEVHTRSCGLDYVIDNALWCHTCHGRPGCSTSVRQRHCPYYQHQQHLCNHHHNKNSKHTREWNHSNHPSKTTHLPSRSRSLKLTATTCKAFHFFLESTRRCPNSRQSDAVEHVDWSRVPRQNARTQSPSRTSHRPIVILFPSPLSATSSTTTITTITQQQQ